MDNRLDVPVAVANVAWGGATGDKKGRNGRPSEISGVVSIGEDNRRDAEVEVVRGTPGGVLDNARPKVGGTLTDLSDNGKPGKPGNGEDPLSDSPSSGTCTESEMLKVLGETADDAGECTNLPVAVDVDIISSSFERDGHSLFLIKGRALLSYKSNISINS